MKFHHNYRISPSKFLAYIFILFQCCSQDFRHEVNLLVKLRHPNIVQFLGAVTDRKPLMLITEFLRGVSQGICINANVLCYGFSVFTAYLNNLVNLKTFCNMPGHTVLTIVSKFVLGNRHVIKCVTHTQIGEEITCTMP